MKQKIFVAGLFIALLIGGVIIWLKPDPSSSKLNMLTIALDWTPNTNHTGLYVAQAKGWYAQQGIDLKILPYSENVSSTSLVLAGKADVGVSTAEDIIGQNAKNNHLVSLGAISQHNTSGFIVRADSGIASPKDLDGKIYGGYGSPFEAPVITEVIKKDGGSGEFQTVTLNVGALQALENKRVDFVWAFEGWEVIEARHDKLATKFFPITAYGIPDGPNLAIAATPQKIKTDRDKLARFMKATAQGYEYARQHPQAAAQLLIDQNPKATFADTKLVFESQQFLSSHYADAGRKWGVQDQAAWQGYPQFMLDSGAITNAAEKPVNTLDFKSLYTNQFVE